MKDIPNFVKYVPRLLKSVLRWGTTSNHFPRDSKGRKIGVSVAQELDVSNFLNDVPKVPESISE